MQLRAQRLVHGLIGHQHLTAVVGSSVPLADRLPLRIATDRLHFFAADTGQRLEPGSREAVSTTASAERSQAFA